MKNLTGIALLIILLGACTNNKKANQKSIEKEDGNYVHMVTHAFSDVKLPDTFRVELTGATPTEMVLAFTIKSHSGKEIYSININGIDLLGSTDPNVDLRKESNQIEFIRNIAFEFLDEDNFLIPAITPEQVPDEYTPDKNFYNELKKSKLNGFTYRLGKENNFYIAWSQKDNKVKVYYNCC